MIRRGDYGRSRVMQKSLTLFFINQFESAGDRLRVFFVPQKTSADTVALTLSAFIGWSWTKVQTARENFKSREFCFIQVGLERLKAEMCVDSWNLSTKSFRHFWSYCQQAFNQTWHMKVQSRVVDAIDCYLLDAPPSPEEPWYDITHSLAYNHSQIAHPSLLFSLSLNNSIFFSFQHIPFSIPSNSSISLPFKSFFISNSLHISQL